MRSHCINIKAMIVVRNIKSNHLQDFAFRVEFRRIAESQGIVINNTFGLFSRVRHHIIEFFLYV